MPPIDKLLSQYSEPVRSWPGEEWMDEEARANYAAANPPKLQTEGGSIDKGDLLPIVRYPEAKKSPSEWQSSSDVMRQLDDGWRIEPFSRLTAPFKSMAEAWRNQPVLGPMVRPSQMHPEVFNQMSGDAMTVAGTGMTGGIGRAAVGHSLPAGTTELGIFGGRKAKTADIDALGRAEEMLRAGAPRDQVWKDTGWFQGVDGQWKFELDDSSSAYVESEMKPKVYNIAGNKVVGAEGEAGKVLAHPILDAAYPDMTGMKVARTNYRDNRLGQYDDAKGPFGGEEYIGLNMGAPMFEGRDTLLHELQHAVQAREGFAKGASPAQFAADGVPNPAFDVYQKARVSDPELIELTKLYESGAHERALAAVNENWRKNFEPRVDALDQLPYTRATYATEIKPLYDRLFAQSEASNRAISPDYARHDDLWKSLRSRGIPPKEPPRLLKPEDAYRATAGEVEARAVQARKNLTAEQRRERAPWEDFDVAEPQQIVRMDSRGEKGMFAGEKARTADREQLARAKEMAAAGAPREEIWSQTGWFTGPDGKWRFEIDDSAMKPAVGMRDWIDRENGVTMAPHIGAAYEKAASELTPNAPVRMKRLYDHPELDQAYPHGFTSTPEHQSILGLPVQLIEGGNTSGFYSADGWKGRPVIGIHETLPPGPAKETALHEMQHAIQDSEGFARGASPDAINKDIEAARGALEIADRNIGDAKMQLMFARRDGSPDVPEIENRIRNLQEWRRGLIERATGDGADRYKRAAGEAEARLVQKRMDLTPEQRRARAPWLDYDVPESDQIVRFGSGEGASVSEKPGLGDLIAETQRQHAFADKAIQEAIASGNPKLVATRGGDLKSVMTKAPDHDGYRVTTFSGDEPMGHRDYPNTPEGMKGLRQDLVSQGLRPPEVMASIDPLSMAMGSAPARSIDPLGYYSPTLEAALKLAQNKGTPEQMLAQLKKAGAKDSEIEVSGLKKMFEGKKAVTKDEIVKALEEGKVGLEEKVYSNQPAPDWIDGYAKNAGYPSGQAMADAQGVSLSQVQSDAIEMFGPPQSTTKYADYSLDPQNPTYREVVLHLPESSAVGRMKEAYEAAQKRYQAAVAKQDQIDRRKPVMTPEEQAVIDEVKAAQAELQAASQPVADLNFRSGHFDEPNIVGHMMVSETRLPGNPQARVLTLDQVQSDWGQKIRDGGVRDEGKIQELKSKIAEIEQVTGPIRAEHERYGKELLNRIDPGSRASVDGGLFSATKDRSLPEEVRKEASAWLSRAYDLNNNDATRLLYAELRTAEAATPGHPLVNTTDQWLNTTLRRAIRMAAEEGQDYIAMPSGKTMYAAQEAGMGSSVGDKARSGIVSFYGGMPEEMGEVMSNLKQAATKAPNESVINVLDAKTIDALASSGILDKKKIENISAARVLKNAEARFQGIVPKNLYALLQKLDKNTPPPQAIDTLDSPSGKTGLGEGFTLFKITPEAKKAAKESGQPLFRFGGRVA